MTLLQKIRSILSVINYRVNIQRDFYSIFLNYSSRESSIFSFNFIINLWKIYENKKGLTYYTISRRSDNKEEDKSSFERSLRNFALFKLTKQTSVPNWSPDQKFKLLLTKHTRIRCIITPLLLINPSRKPRRTVLSRHPSLLLSLTPPYLSSYWKLCSLDNERELSRGKGRPQRFGPTMKTLQAPTHLLPALHPRPRTTHSSSFVSRMRSKRRRRGGGEGIRLSHGRKAGGEGRPRREKVKVKRGGNCGGSLIVVGVAGSDVSLGRGGRRGFFSSLIILYRGERGRGFVIDECSEFDRWIRLGTILFLEGVVLYLTRKIVVWWLVCNQNWETKMEDETRELCKQKVIILARNKNSEWDEISEKSFGSNDVEVGRSDIKIIGVDIFQTYKKDRLKIYELFRKELKWELLFNGN